MQQSSITVKGQVTIPAFLRKKFGLQRGDKVVFREEDNKIYLQPVQNSVEAAFGIITPSTSATLEEMDEAVKKRGVNFNKSPAPSFPRRWKSRVRIDNCVLPICQF